MAEILAAMLPCSRLYGFLGATLAHAQEAAAAAAGRGAAGAAAAGADGGAKEAASASATAAAAAAPNVPHNEYAEWVATYSSEEYLVGGGLYGIVSTVQYKPSGQLWARVHKGPYVVACALRPRKAMDLSQAHKPSAGVRYNSNVGLLCPNLPRCNVTAAEVSAAAQPRTPRAYSASPAICSVTPNSPGHPRPQGSHV